MTQPNAVNASINALPFVDGPLPAAFERRVVVIVPGEDQAYDPPDWHDAIVAVDQGSVLLESNCGRRATYASGDLIWLDGLDLRTIRNAGDTPTVLIAVRRRAHALD